MTQSHALTNLCIYRVQPGKEAAFEELLKVHWPTMNKLGLASDVPSIIYKGTEHLDRTGERPPVPIYFEVFSWNSAEGPMKAHESPEVMAVWGPMGELCEGRGEGRPAMDFPGVEEIKLY